MFNPKELPAAAIRPKPPYANFFFENSPDLQPFVNGFLVTNFIDGGYFFRGISYSDDQTYGVNSAARCNDRGIPVWTAFLDPGTALPFGQGVVSEVLNPPVLLGQVSLH